MKKTVYNTLLAEPNESLLAAFNNKRLATQIDDARNNAALRAWKIGHPQGAVDVPGKRGWIYAQRLLPNNESVTQEVFVPSNRKGKTRVKFKAGDPIVPRKTSDSNPTYWIYDGIPPPTRTMGCSCDAPGGCFTVVPNGQCSFTEIGYGSAGTGGSGNRSYRIAVVSELQCPCDDVAGGSLRPRRYCVPSNTDSSLIPGFQYWASGPTTGCTGGTAPGDVTVSAPCNTIPSDTTSANTNYDYYSGDGPGGSLPASFPSGNAPNGSGDEGYNDVNTTVTPGYSPVPPFPPGIQELWWDGLYTRRYNGTGPTGWSIVSGPTPGTFSEFKTDAALEPYRLAYQHSTSNIVKLATATDTTVLGKIVGITLNAANSAGRIVVVQSQGLLPFQSAYAPGTELFMGDDGKLTDTPPAAASDKVLLRVGVVTNSLEVQMDMGPQILRSSL